MFNQTIPNIIRRTSLYGTPVWGDYCTMIILWLWKYNLFFSWPCPCVGGGVNYSSDEAGGSQYAGNLASDITVLFLVLHGGNVLDGMQETGAKASDIHTFRTAFDAVVRAHFPSAQGHIAIRMITCPATCHEAVSLITRYGRSSFCLMLFSTSH